MKTIIPILVFLLMSQSLFSQSENGIMALDLPMRNSLMFNRYTLHPTFSFVREQNKYINATHQRELTQVEDAPQSYLFNYSGRFAENVGAGVGLFQKNVGILTSFGGLLNIAYNARLQEESNLTFGLNLGVYKSGVNNGKVVSNFEDPALQNIPTHVIITANPGINYGTGFLDFGIAYNNAIAYDFGSAGMIENDPQKGIQGHFMYTGYLGGYGFFGESRFTALAQSEFQKDNTHYSGHVMLTVPKGIWAQAGYHSLYGPSGGIGINITPQIAIEYNYERPLGAFANLGAAHEITLAYRFKNDNYYDYSRDDELAGLFSSDNPRRERTKKKTSVAKSTPAQAPSQPEVDRETEEQERIAAEEQAQREAEEQARIAAEAQAQREAEEQARIATQEQAQREAEEQ
ncbi:MAG: type IX secretion system membrane protein PorP/SprF, partial [Flavobacteriaceae bacterium]|nr:type IX secretion system membrane protein PorP/SprF [Flavobacteriaceae bacterium]